MKTVLITGATGFLGSNITNALVENDYIVYAIHRQGSDFYRCKKYYNKINWINVTLPSWKDSFPDRKFDILIHTAWHGIDSKSRDNWELQLINFDFSKEIFEYAADRGVKKIIALGSQAEYGVYHNKANEDDVPYPIEAYGAVKLLTLHLLNSFATIKKIEWYWIRVFSVFGTNENKNSLIPSVILKLKKGSEVELTSGNQKYDYMHSDDFVNNLLNVVETSKNCSGVFNLCSGNEIEIKSLLLKLSQHFPKVRHLMRFGAISHRPNQTMYLVGNNNKFQKAFGNILMNDLECALQKTISSYKSK